VNAGSVHWTRPLPSIYSAGEGLIDRLLCVVGAVLFSQIPEFIQQYLQRLGGHLDEARRQLGHFQEIATNAGLTLDGLMARSQGSPEPTVIQLGRLIRDTASRVDALAAAEAGIRSASLFSRPLVFLRHLDLSITRATWAVFKPAVPTTVEGLVYAGLGVLLMLALYYGGVKYPVRRAWRRRTERRTLAGRPSPATPQRRPGGVDRPG
jgi:Protein of unknown function (DUF2937)